MIRRVRRLALELPRNLKLAYCLSFDPRVPPLQKAALGAALALILTPFVNVPAWIPVVGELDVVALTLLATHLYIAASDAEVVAEQERLIAQRRSRFDADVASGKHLAVIIAKRFPGRHEDIPGAEVVGHPDDAGIQHHHGVTS